MCFLLILVFIIMKAMNVYCRKFGNTISLIIKKNHPALFHHPITQRSSISFQCVFLHMCAHTHVCIYVMCVLQSWGHVVYLDIYPDLFT